MAELVTKTRRRRGDVDADDAAYGLTALSAELLRAAGKVSGKMPGNPHVVVMSYCDENDLKLVDDLVEHYAAAAELVKPSIGDAEMAVSSLAFTLCRIHNLVKIIPPLNSQLFEPVPGARDREKVQTKGHAELLELLGKVCAQYKAEEKDRNSSEYEKAFDALEAAQELSLDDKSQWVARGELYKATGVLHSCVCVKDFNEKVLETPFDKTLHLPAGALDLSAEGYTPHLAAEPGAASRLALSKIGDVRTRRPTLFSNLIIRVDGVVEALPGRRRRATPSTGSVPRRLVLATRILRCCGSVIVGCPWPYLRVTTLPNVATTFLDPTCKDL